MNAWIEKAVQSPPSERTIGQSLSPSVDSLGGLSGGSSGGSSGGPTGDRPADRQGTAATAGLPFDEAVLGRGLPAEVQACIARAGQLRSEPEQALQFLHQAQRLAPAHPAVLIALYRFYFYGHCLSEARGVAVQALAAGARALGLPEDWRQLPLQPLPDARDDAAVRFYLFCLKGYAYLSLRLNDIESAATALAVLQTVDPGDCIGARLLDRVLARRGRDDDDDEIGDEIDDVGDPLGLAAMSAEPVTAPAAAAGGRADTEVVAPRKERP